MRTMPSLYRGQTLRCYERNGIYSKDRAVGLIATNKQGADTYNRSAGVDFAYRPFDNMDVNGVWARTFDEEQPDQTDAWTLGSRWRNDRFMLEGAYMDIGEEL